MTTPWVAGRSRKTHCLRGHDLELHGRVREGKGRACRLCDRERDRERRRRRREENGGHYAAKFADWNCPCCGNHRVVTERTALRYRTGELSGLCEECREIKIEPSDQLKQWWLDRYSLDDIRAMAAGLDLGDAFPVAEVPRSCAGCGVPWERSTPGCLVCSERRRSRRKRAERGGRVAA